MTSTNSKVASYTQFACIGTGFSGIGLGASLRRWYGIDDIRFFERNSNLGGTWFVNRYPGCACDVPSALYSFSFEPNPNWTRVLPPHDELWEYLNDVAKKYELIDKMTFNVNVERCEWMEERKRWQMTIRRNEDDTVTLHECQFLFSATGQLMKPRPIDVPGSEKFKGQIFHSSRWDKNVKIDGQKVVVFGNGCTASQIIPAIVSKTKHLTQVIRTKHWVLPPVDSKTTNVMKAVFRNIPGTMMIQRFLIFVWTENALRGFYMTRSGTSYRQRAQAHAETYMKKMAPERYHKKLIPDFELGCKRRIFDNGYLESLHAEDLTLLDDPVLEIIPEGIRTKNGVIEADIIVIANGFETNNAVGGLNIVGRGGETIDQHWESFGGSEAYNCTLVNNFPNFFILLGPNSLTGHTSTIIAAENSINYVLRIIKPLLDDQSTTVEVKKEAEEHYVNQLQRDLQNTVWATGCNSWYLRGSDEKKKWNASTYPYFQAYFWYRCLFPAYDELKITGTTKPRGKKRRWQLLAALALVGYLISFTLGILKTRLVGNLSWHQLMLGTQLLLSGFVRKFSGKAA
ncbi:ATP-binding cassette [Colletotrichum truncatum]|uniref:ATP-binding cassette n=1 Tax=Colletotrichum truncatum TaxID=5467 RepID=A0ACC3YK14_COLTU|nr:ATP-binding cassette [Colletotrichum truncatum]KAF6797459.1 ATP-binding cassette [Colletotrichum truncatum]